MRIVYKPFGVLVGMVATVVAANMWRRLWGLVAQEAKPPKATDRDSGWPEIVIASAMRGAVFAVVRAVIKRSGATAFSNVTGTWQTIGRERNAETLTVAKAIPAAHDPHRLSLRR